MKKLLTVFAGIVGLSATGGALAQTPAAQPRTISVSGEAHQQVAPDQAILTMSIVSKDKELSVAKSKNDALTEKLVQITKEFTILKEKIATSSLYISPEYNYNDNKQVFVGYTVNRSLRITIDDLNKQERLLSAIVAAKIDQVNGVEFQLAERETYAAPLRLKAFDNARSKAQALAQASGSKLGPAISIATDDAAVIPPGRPIPMMAKMGMVDGAAPSVAPSLPGLIGLQENVQVIFTLE